MLLLFSPKSISTSSLPTRTRPKSKDVSLCVVLTVETTSSRSEHCTLLTPVSPFSLRRFTRRFIFFALSDTERTRYRMNCFPTFYV